MVPPFRIAMSEEWEDQKKQAETVRERDPFTQREREREAEKPTIHASEGTNKEEEEDEDGEGLLTGAGLQPHDVRHHVPKIRFA